MTKPNKADEFASTVALDLRKSEHLIDDTSMQLAESIANSLAGRRSAGLSSLCGQRAIAAASKALHTLTEAGVELAAAHSLAQRDAKRMGLNYSSLIPTEPKPDDERPAMQSGRLAAA